MSEAQGPDPKQMGADEFSAWLSRLYTDYADQVLRVAYFYLGDRHQAEDVTQDVFIKLMENKPILLPEHEKSWLFKVALNRCRDLWRSQWVKRVLLGTRALEIIPGPDPIDEFEEKTALMQAINALSPPEREAIILFYYQNLSLKEIAQLINCSEGTVSSRLSRGREKLRSHLKEED